MWIADRYVSDTERRRASATSWARPAMKPEANETTLPSRPNPAASRPVKMSTAEKATSTAPTPTKTLLCWRNRRAPASVAAWSLAMLICLAGFALGWILGQLSTRRHP